MFPSFAPLALLALTSDAQLALRASIVPPPYDDDALHGAHRLDEWYLLHGVHEDESCIGNEQYCTEGTEFYSWISANCPRTCEVWFDETREGNLRPDCDEYVFHCPKDDEDGAWARTYCAKACELFLAKEAQRPWKEMWGMAHDNPMPLIGLVILALLAYVKKLKKDHCGFNKLHCH